MAEGLLMANQPKEALARCLSVASTASGRSKRSCRMMMSIRTP
jgi:hypothetical protein